MAARVPIPCKRRYRKAWAAIGSACAQERAEEEVAAAEAQAGSAFWGSVWRKHNLQVSSGGPCMKALPSLRTLTQEDSLPTGPQERRGGTLQIFPCHPSDSPAFPLCPQ